ncbi:hypothetical protein ACIQCF_07235 [Streptomyces sp. NPDC088353]|uniref:hypothetical protein n=1 Tax=Streptomyces sp. NPDC088353 TaxID=3365855 RepID=UPI00381A4416
MARRQENPGFEEFTPGGKRRCQARSKASDGAQCGAYAMRGQDVCRFHGGATKKARAAGAQRVAEAELTEQTRRALAVLDVAPVDNPLTALSELAGQVVAWKDALAERVNALERIRFTDDKGAEQLRAEVALYERSMDRCINVLGTIGRLKIDERLAAISEKQADVVIAAIEAALAHAGVIGERAADAKKVAARHLRSVS